MPDDRVRFLVVDDLAGNIAAIEGLLGREGLDLVSARSGAEALELLLAHDFALALVDVQMPGMDGFELAQLMRGTERTRHIPIVFITAVATDEQRRFRGYELGAIDYVMKPIEPQVLRNKADLFFRLERKRRDLLRQTEELRQLHQRLAAHTDNSPLAAIEFDPEYRTTFWSSGAERMFGWSAADVLGKAIGELRWVHEEDADSVAALSADMLTGKTPRNVHANRNYRKDGTIIHCEWHNSALLDASGQLLSVRSQVLDVTERKRAEEALRKSEESIRAIIEASHYAVLTVDREGRIALVNTQAEQLFGFARNELLGASIDRLIPERFRHEHASCQAGFLANPTARIMGPGRDLYCLHKDGSEIPVEIGLTPVRTSDGDFILVSALDITERKRAEQHKEMLLKELDHRLKNTLATVQAIAMQTFKGSELGQKATDAFHGRLSALARAHTLLIRGNWESAELRAIVAQAVSAHGGKDLDRFRIEGPDVWLGPKPALAIALALHELCTNAAKYGALLRPDGLVSIVWTIGNGAMPSRLRIRWEESGGPEVQKPKRKGFGSRLIETLLADELDAEIALDYRPEGLVCTLDAPLPVTAQWGGGGGGLGFRSIAE